MGVDQNNWRLFFDIEIIHRLWMVYLFNFKTLFDWFSMVFIQKIIKGYWEDIHGILRWES